VIRPCPSDAPAWKGATQPWRCVPLLACPAVRFRNPSSCDGASIPGRQVALAMSGHPHDPSSLRASVASAPYFDSRRTSALHDCVARHSKTRFYPRAKKSRSNFPRFDFSKRGICARDAPKTPPETHSRFPRIRAQKHHELSRFPRAGRFLVTGSTPQNQVENQNRRFPQFTCTWRATNRRSLKRVQ
jgi:hypothetical protein